LYPKWQVPERSGAEADPHSICWYNSCHTEGVKTAVSLPDDLFRKADSLARRLKVSRSKLYAMAILEFLDRRRTNSVTERLNEVYSHHPAKLDPALHRAQLKSIDKDRW
jgi:metal-responsive CopG/Arc/MetJ family transcriptional regulator